ncbi:hypothetical protein HA466_0231240 [Hirschfeldia incana]|nr:hypothetical protein HA466_0231240 [Hirschfeldia incana]
MSSSGSHIFQSRQWMYSRINQETGNVTEEFKNGLQDFMAFATNQEICIERGIGAFFRDLCTRTLWPEGIQQMQDNISVQLCDLEKIFPPSFFDVMEHLAIHLPREAALGGPVQYRWMYFTERVMFQLKKMAKNPSRVEGSIIAQSLNEEMSHFSSYYFPPQIKTKARGLKRYDDGGEKPNYPVDGVPDIFTQIGRLGGKIKDVWLTEQDLHHVHTYILKNCDDVIPYESLFIEEVKAGYPHLSDDQVENIKDANFAGWLKYYVESGAGGKFETWFEELVEGPKVKVTTSPMYFTRGFSFRSINRREQSKSTVNCGISAKGDSVDFYGILTEIIEVTYPGLVNMKCVLFRCEWYDPTQGRGTRKNHLGVTDVNSVRRYTKYDPFILASQADQVCYIPYPNIKTRSNPWLAVIKINPRGRVEGVTEQDPPMQQDILEEIIPVDPTLQEMMLVDLHNQDSDDIWSSSEEEEEEDIVSEQFTSESE